MLTLWEPCRKIQERSRRAVTAVLIRKGPSGRERRCWREQGWPGQPGAGVKEQRPRPPAPSAQPGHLGSAHPGSPQVWGRAPGAGGLQKFRDREPWPVKTRLPSSLFQDLVCATDNNNSYCLSGAHDVQMPLKALCPRPPPIPTPAPQSPGPRNAAPCGDRVSEETTRLNEGPRGGP